MSEQFFILSAAIALSAVSFAFSIAVFIRTRRQRMLLEFTEKQIEDLDVSLSRIRELYETSAARTAEHARRIAWLETRVRQPKSIGDEFVTETPDSDAPKETMTERRHRVTALASRGQSVEAIAGTLGLMPGEVELIINLSNAVAPK